MEQRNHAQVRRKGKTTTNKKNSLSLGGTSLPLKVRAAGYGMIVFGHSALNRYIVRISNHQRHPYTQHGTSAAPGGALYVLSEYFAVFGRTWLSDCEIRLTR